MKGPDSGLGKSTGSGSNRGPMTTREADCKGEQGSLVANKKSSQGRKSIGTRGPGQTKGNANGPRSKCEKWRSKVVSQ